jgi:hypothetical protein
MPKLIVKPLGETQWVIHKFPVAATVELYDTVRITCGEDYKRVKYPAFDSYSTILSCFNGAAKVSMLAWEFFREHLGFCPFTYTVDGKMYYDKEADFRTYKEMYARKKPAKFETLMGVQVPTAFLKLMGLVAENRETCVVIDGQIVLREQLTESQTYEEWEPEIGYFEGVEEFVEDALKALSDDSVPKRTEFLKVYEVLRLQMLDHETSRFIYYDTILEMNSANLARAGLLHSRVATAPVYPRIWDFVELTVQQCQFIPNQMIETYKLYDDRRVMQIRDGKLTPLQDHIYAYLRTKGLRT